MSDFRYHAFVSGISGHITAPFNEIIPIQASLSLPLTGGFATACVENFNFHHIVSCESIRSVLAGNRNPTDGSFDAVATVTITGLNILNLVTADRVVARIASSHPKDKPHSITPIGSSYDNLRIAGRKVDVTLATETFHEFDNAEKVRAEIERNASFRDLWLAAPAPGKLGVCSLAQNSDLKKLPSCMELDEKKHVLHVRGFGRIHLAELTMTDTERSITMLQVELGSTPSGTVTTGTGAGNGSDYGG